MRYPCLIIISGRPGDLLDEGGGVRYVHNMRGRRISASEHRDRTRDSSASCDELQVTQINQLLLLSSWLLDAAS